MTPDSLCCCCCHCCSAAAAAGVFGPGVPGGRIVGVGAGLEGGVFRWMFDGAFCFLFSGVVVNQYIRRCKYWFRKHQ